MCKSTFAGRATFSQRAAAGRGSSAHSRLHAPQPQAGCSGNSGVSPHDGDGLGEEGVGQRIAVGGQVVPAT